MTHTYGIPGTRVVAYTYEADYHCTEDAETRFGLDDDGFLPEDATDREGNPIGAVFTSDLDGGDTVAACSDCGAVICLCCGEKSNDRTNFAEPCRNCGTEWRTQE